MEIYVGNRNSQLFPGSPPADRPKYRTEHFRFNSNFRIYNCFILTISFLSTHKWNPSSLFLSSFIVPEEKLRCTDEKVLTTPKQRSLFNTLPAHYSITINKSRKGNFPLQRQCRGPRFITDRDENGGVPIHANISNFLNKSNGEQSSDFLRGATVASSLLFSTRYFDVKQLERGFLEENCLKKYRSGQSCVIHEANLTWSSLNWLT